LRLFIPGWAQEVEAPSFPVHDVGACEQAHVRPADAPAFPEREAQQLEYGQSPVGEMELQVGQLPGWSARVGGITATAIDSSSLVIGPPGAGRRGTTRRMHPLGQTESGVAR